MQTRHDFHGLEFDWFAVDAEGFVGVFFSAGWGPVPDFVFAHLDAQRVIEQHLRPSADIGPMAHLPEGLPALGRIYVYDWTATYGPYQRDTVPVQPMRLTEFGFAMELQSAFVVLPTTRFSVAAVLQAADLPSFTDIDTRRAY